MKPAFDFGYLHSLSDDPAFVPQMIQLFINIVPKQVDSLKNFIEKDDAIQSGLVLHQLKPSMEAFGLKALALNIIELEDQIKKGHSPSTQIHKYEKLIEDINLCIASIKQIEKAE